MDAAWAGAFAILPEQRALYFQGLDAVDSFAFNGHKALCCGWEW